MLRQLFYMTVIFLGTAIDVAAQEREARPEQPPSDWETFGADVQTRFGKMSQLNRLPYSMENEDSRFYGSSKIGLFNTWLGPERNALNSRFRSESDPQPLLPSDFLAEKVKTTKPPVASANTLAPTATPSDSALLPPRRLPNFFERSGIMDTITETPEENLIRSPTGPRWFRDLGRKPEGLPGLVPRPVDRNSGEAISVGPELLQNQQGQLPAQPSNNTVAEKNLRVDTQTAARNKAEAQWRFERKLEGMLLSDPSVHFLSPVQVSFKNGIASVRGVVPNKEYKIAAGNVLLTDPAVKQVNNLISILSADPSQLPEPIEPK